jgi:hypothetical protein
MRADKLRQNATTFVGLPPFGSRYYCRAECNQGSANRRELRDVLPSTEITDVPRRRLTEDRPALLAFFDFPPSKEKGILSAKTAKSWVFNLVNAAAKTWQ